ncbi:MAG: DUF2459 domain-containing protein, partial [Methyloceanibacter sp.]
MRVIVLCMLLWGCAAAPVAHLPEAPKEVAVFVVPQGGHTGLAVRMADIPAALIPEKRDFAGADYLEIGWGERDFYMAGTAGPWLAFKAVFFANRSVLHVAGAPGGLAILFPRSEILEIRLSRPALEGLLRYVHDAIERAGPGATASLGQGLYGDGRFYAGRETFHLLRNCNVWTAGALRAAGLPVRDAHT